MFKAAAGFLVAMAVATSAFGQDAPPPPPVDPWTSSLGAGLAVTSGNTDTQNVNISFGTAFDPKTIHLFKAEALYLRGESDGETQADKTTALGRYERTVSDRTFWFGELSYLRDPFKSIDYLISPIAGFGYHVIKTENRMLSFDAGVGASFESSPELGSKSGGAVKAGESYEWSISPTSKFTQHLSGLFKADDFDDALYHFDAGIATTIAARAELKVSYVYDYKNRPPSAEIEKGDSALFAAILYKF
jgi:putative salt-induced outer membrane protein